MAVLYELALLGQPDLGLASAVQSEVSKAIAPFGLSLGKEVAWAVMPKAFAPPATASAAVAYFGTTAFSDPVVQQLMHRSVPVLPVLPHGGSPATSLPSELHPFNCLSHQAASAERLASALLECVGLLPRQRRVFLSYRRAEAREAALQLFDELSARVFDVFLDTHGISPAVDFQTVLWHRLCDSDVLVMLDTPTYFESRWTSAEFGRALAKGISVLRVAWPDSMPSPRSGTASRVELLNHEVNPSSGRLAASAIDRICLQLEGVRSQSHAVRTANLASRVRNAIEEIGGQVSGVGLRKAIYVTLPDGLPVVVHPSVGVPTSTSLHDATVDGASEVAVVYDSVGLDPTWQKHLDWLGNQVQVARWVKAHEAAWQFADWKNRNG